jgi:hypothetical protein
VIDMPTARYKKLFDACDTFARAANILEGLALDSETPLREVLPGIWPTVGELGKLRDEMVALGWTNNYEK